MSTSSLLQPVELLAVDQNVPTWLFAAAKALRGWARGQEVSPEAFAAAVDEAANVQIGYSNRFTR